MHHASSRSWSEIDDDILIIVIKWLSRIEHISSTLSIVCCSLRRIVKEYIPSSEAIPWLMFPLKPEEDGCRFYRVEEGMFYVQRKSVFRTLGSGIVLDHLTDGSYS